MFGLGLIIKDDGKGGFWVHIGLVFVLSIHYVKRTL
jgi:hypothetical protein